MPVETYDERVDNFRRKKPSCRYCIANKNYNQIEYVAECSARQQRC